MRKLGIKAQYVKPYTSTMVEPDFSHRLKHNGSVFKEDHRMGGE